MAVEELAGRITMTAAADTITNQNGYRVRAVQWTGAANGNTLLLDDQDNKDVAGCVAETGALEKYWYFGEQGIPVTTLTATTLGGGRLIIYIH